MKLGSKISKWMIIAAIALLNSDGPRVSADTPETLFAYTMVDDLYSMGVCGVIVGDRNATSPANFSLVSNKVTALNGNGPTIFNFFDSAHRSRLILHQYTNSDDPWRLLPNQIINPFAPYWTPLVAQPTWNDVANLHAVAAKGRWLYAAGYDLSRIAVVNMNLSYAEVASYQFPTAWPGINVPSGAECHGECLKVVGDYLYALFTINPGGDDYTYANSILVKLKINTLSGSLTYISHLEVGKNAITLKAFRNKLYVCALGGRKNGGSNNTETRLDIIDLATFTTTSVATIASIGGNFRDIAIRDADHMYILVGNYNRYSNIIGGVYHTSVANITSPASWTKVIDLDSPGLHWGIYVENNRLWFVKGYQLDIYTPLPTAGSATPAKTFTTAEMGRAWGNLNSATLVADYIDTEPPTAPDAIKIANAVEVNGKIFTKKPVKISWSASTDLGSPPGGIDYYTVNNKPVFTNTYTDYGTLFPADGLYTVSIIAYDKEGNASQVAEYQFTLDTRISDVDASGIAVDSDYTHKTATVSWSEPSEDFGNVKGSGIKGYQAVLTQSDQAPQNISPGSDLLTVTQKTFKDLSAQKVYYVWIRAIDQAGNVSAWTAKQFSPQPQPAQITECIPVSKIVNGQPLYAVNLKVSDVDTASYVIKRQEAGKPATLKEVDEVKYDVISGRAFKQVDSGLTKHTQYQYFVYTKNALGELSSQSTMAIVTTGNIEPQCKIKGLRQTEVTTNLSFTLGVKTDPEGDPLTYRLYLRSPGGGDGIVVQSWEPKVDDFKVSYTFQDKTDYQWRISCIETNSAFASTEVFASEWNDLTIDTDGIIPVVSNERGLMSEINLPSKKQPLTFTVEFNSKKKFTNYQWIFGDGSTANGATASHNYVSLNQYLITVTATDESSVIRKGVRKLYIENTHQGKLYDSEEWSGDHGVYGEVIVPQGMTLTLKPGTNVQMTSPEGSIRVNGTIYAVDLNQGIFIDRQSPLEYWKEIRFEGSGTGTLSGVTVSHAQRGVVTVGAGRLSLTKVIFDSNEIGLNYISGSVTATNSTFKSNLKFGIKNESDYNLPTLTNCIFSGNGVHYVDAAELPFALDELNQPPSSGNVFQ